MTMMTKQEIFDKVSVHLVRQDKICEGDEGCLYHGPDGLRCAVGCLIPKKYYRKKMEENTVGNLFTLYKKEMLGCRLSSRYRGLLNQLQLIHDESGPLLWRIDLEKLAMTYKVSPAKFMKVKSK